MQANDFPYQHTAQTQFDWLASLLHDYYEGKVRKGSRVVIVLMVLKSISRMIISVVVFRNVKGVVSQFAALIAVNLVYQKLDQTIGARDRGPSARDAVRDAALELLTVKIIDMVYNVEATAGASKLGATHHVPVT